MGKSWEEKCTCSVCSSSSEIMTHRDSIKYTTMLREAPHIFHSVLSQLYFYGSVVLFDKEHLLLPRGLAQIFSHSPNALSRVMTYLSYSSPSPEIFITVSHASMVSSQHHSKHFVNHVGPPQSRVTCSSRSHSGSSFMVASAHPAYKEYTAGIIIRFPFPILCLTPA